MHFIALIAYLMVISTSLACCHQICGRTWLFLFQVSGTTFVASDAAWDPILDCFGRSNSWPLMPMSELAASIRYLRHMLPRRPGRLCGNIISCILLAFPNSIFTRYIWPSLWYCNMPMKSCAPPDALYFYPLIGFLLVTYVYAACYITYYVRIFYCSSLTTLRCCVSVSKWIIICSILGLSDRRTAGIHQSIICYLGPWSQWGFGCPSFFILVSATSRHASTKSVSSSSSDWRSLRGLPLDYFGLDILGLWLIGISQSFQAYVWCWWGKITYVD